MVENQLEDDGEFQCPFLLDINKIPSSVRSS